MIITNAPEAHISLLYVFLIIGNKTLIHSFIHSFKSRNVVFVIQEKCSLSETCQVMAIIDSCPQREKNLNHSQFYLR